MPWEEEAAVEGILVEGMIRILNGTRTCCVNGSHVSPGLPVYRSYMYT